MGVMATGDRNGEWRMEMATGDKNIWIEMVNQVELEMASRCIGF